MDATLQILWVLAVLTPSALLAWYMSYHPGSGWLGWSLMNPFLLVMLFIFFLLDVRFYIRHGCAIDVPAQRQCGRAKSGAGSLGKPCSEDSPSGKAIAAIPSFGKKVPN